MPLASAEAVEKLSLSIRQSKITDIGLIVVDTFSASLPGCDENSGAEMSLVMTGLQRLSEAHQACVMVIAHTGKDFDRGVRGWSGMHANSDAVLFIEAPLPDGGRRGRVAKVKDGECSAFTFSLEKRELGTDGDGDLIETCVVQNLQVAEQTVSKRAPKKDADAEIIKAAFLKAPKVVVPADVTDGGVRGIQISALRAAAFTAGFGEEGRPLPDDDPVITTRWKDRRQKSWERAVKKLCSDSWLSRNQIWVWRTLSDDRPNPVLS